MRKKKEPTVKLIVPGTTKERDFAINHAERLLDMGAKLNGGWVLPETSNYTYNEEYGLRVKSDKTNTAKAD